MKKKILIVEDEKINALYLKKLLESLDFEVLQSVNNGRGAVEAALGGGPDLILMDIMLEGDMDGIDASIEIHKQSDVPIIFISAFSDESLVERAMDASPYGYIIKPFEKRNLATVLTLALHKYHLEKSLTEALSSLTSWFSSCAIAKAVEVPPLYRGPQKRVGEPKAIAQTVVCRRLGDHLRRRYDPRYLNLSVPAEYLRPRPILIKDIPDQMRLRR